MMKEIKQTSYRDKVIYEGAIYHITQRAPGKEMLFIEENDYINFIYLVKKYAEDFNLDIFCFCLMPNHIHLLLRINKHNLSEAMKSLFTAYAVRFNRKYERKGHVFCGVYRASLCLDDAHLLGASLYIHLNSQKARLIDDASGYRWSSVGVYINSQSKAFLKRDFILKIIDDDIEKATSLYKDMFMEYSIADYEDIAENPNVVIEFTKAILKQLSKLLRHGKFNKDFIVSEIKIDDMIKKFQNRKNRRLNGSGERKDIVYLIKQLQLRGFNLTDISKMLNISRSTLYKLYK